MASGEPTTVAADARTIRVTFKLFASLSRFLPAGADRNQVKLAVPVGTTPARLIADYNLPVAMCALVVVNGAFVAPEDRSSRVLADGDSLAIWPPVAGG